MNIDDDKIRDSVLKFYLNSAEDDSFNGILASRLFSLFEDSADFIASLERLLVNDDIDCVFAKRDINPHIKRLPDLPKEKQLEWLHEETLDSFCIYPSRKILMAAVDGLKFIERPFSRSMLLGESQLSFVTFQLAALDRYRSDPRYVVKFHDYMGDMYISDEYYLDPEFLDRDKVSINSFGLGFSENRVPYLVVFYRYLSTLNAEHQRYWDSFRAEKSVPMCKQYFDSSIAGDWWENRSLRYAIQEEIRLIIEMSEAAFSIPIFREAMNEELPIDVTAFSIPSKDNFHHFIHTWDKILSDNINKKFFRGKVALEDEVERNDGKVMVTPRGTLKLLNEWLEKVVRSSKKSELIAEIMTPLRQVRSLRQTPAHKFEMDEFSDDFYVQRREILLSIFYSVTCLRAFLGNHPKAAQIEVPTWLDDREIDVF